MVMRKMIKLYKRAAIITAAAGMLLFSGCKIGNKDIVVSGTLNNKQVFQIGDTTCGIKEAKVYLVNYQNIYGTAYGLDLWEHDFGEESLEDYVKDITLDELVQVVCMNQLAKSEEMVLTEEENLLAAEAAKEYYATLTEDEIAYMGVSEADICEYYEHYALAQKLYSSLTSEVNEEVSDDEARVMEVMQIFVSEEAKAKEVEAKLSAGEDFASVANNYNELSSIQLYISRDSVPEEVEAAAFLLDNNEISGKIAVEDGYYFIRCLNKYHVEMTEANKENIVEKREAAAFDDVYNEFVSSLGSNINEEVWEELNLDTESEIQTDSFFTVFEKYFG